MLHSELAQYAVVGCLCLELTTVNESQKTGRYLMVCLLSMTEAQKLLLPQADSCSALLSP
jgi:hypothetical protein